MSFRGDTDAAGFDPDTPSTWPDATPTDGDFWRLTADLTLDGVVGRPSDLLYAVEHPWPTLHGRPWRWSIHQTGEKPWLMPPLPTVGCPMGDRWPGWQLTVEGLYNPRTGNRRFGDLRFGDGTFGGVVFQGGSEWADLTPKSYDLGVRYGDETGNFGPPVDEAYVELVDPAEEVVSFALPIDGTRPHIGTIIRIGTRNPDGDWSPLMVGRLRSMEDVHDAPPRLVRLDAFGMMVDLTTVLPSYRGSARSSANRIKELLNSTWVSWAWGADYSGASDWQLLPTPVEYEAEALGEVHRAAIAGGSQADTHRNGIFRVRDWPLEPVGDRFEVSDCPEGDELPVVAMSWVQNEEAVLNAVVVENTKVQRIIDELGQVNTKADLPPRKNVEIDAGYYVKDEERHYYNNGRTWVRFSITESLTGPDVVVREDADSINVLGARLPAAYGFPLVTETREPDDMVTFANRVLGRLSRTAIRCESIEVDARQDARWLEVLRTIDTGTPITVRRRGLGNLVEIEGVVTAVEQVLSPDQWTATIYILPTTRSF